MLDPFNPQVGKTGDFFCEFQVAEKTATEEAKAQWGHELLIGCSAPSFWGPWWCKWYQIVASHYILAEKWHMEIEWGE